MVIAHIHGSKDGATKKAQKEREKKPRKGKHRVALGCFFLRLCSIRLVALICKGASETLILDK